ncbi:MAG TPA: MBL fold metallo-hydrolase [Candidatus Thermoplasmatota archaeon]|nr:MBL fold metallo-hydrolase [Candidatus Thermoplasmatota archaeon]
MARNLVLKDDGTEGPREGSIQYIGNGTMLLRYGGITLLTDPNFLKQGQRVYLGYGLFSKRLTNPAVPFDALPPYDAVVLSHLHGDHFDRIAMKRIPKGTPILTTPKGAEALQEKGFYAARGLEPWESVPITKGRTSLTLTAMPGTHAHGPIGHALPPVMGSLIDFGTPGTPGGFRLLISGDTLVHEGLNEIPRRYPDIDLAILHLGGTRLLGLLATMDAKEGVEFLRRVSPKHAIPIHYNDYTVFRSALDDFVQEVAAAGLADRVGYVRHGETVSFAGPYGGPFWKPLPGAAAGRPAPAGSGPKPS